MDHLTKIVQFNEIYHPFKFVATVRNHLVCIFLFNRDTTMSSQPNHSDKHINVCKFSARAFHRDLNFLERFIGRLTARESQFRNLTFFIDKNRNRERDPLYPLRLSLSRLRRSKDIGINGLGRRYQLVSHHSSTSRGTWRSLHFSSLLSIHRAISRSGLRCAHISRNSFSRIFESRLMGD